MTFSVSRDRIESVVETIRYDRFKIYVLFKQSDEFAFIILCFVEYVGVGIEQRYLHRFISHDFFSSASVCLFLTIQLYHKVEKNQLLIISKSHFLCGLFEFYKWLNNIFKKELKT